MQYTPYKDIFSNLDSWVKLIKGIKMYIIYV